jgi:hypothetical protein
MMPDQLARQEEVARRLEQQATTERIANPIDDLKHEQAQRE